MSYRAIAATNNRVRSVNLIEYNNGPDGSVVLTINHSIYIGRFPTMEAAELAVEGLLVKCGCDSPTERRLLVPTINNAIDYVPNPTPAWTNVTTTISTSTYGRTVAQVLGINRPINIRATRNNANVDLWYKTAATTITGNTDPATDGYTLYVEGTDIVVQPNYYLAFKGKPPAEITGTVITDWSILNASVTPNVTLDSLVRLTANP